MTSVARARPVRRGPLAAEIGSARWLSVREAAAHLSLSEEALRKGLERGAIRVPDGGTEAHLDGVRGRKLGRRWRVQLSAAWLEADPRVA